MKLSFWTLGTPGWSNEAVVDAAKRFGYAGVDLRCTANGNISLDSSDAEIDALRQLFATNGIEIASLLAYNQRGNEDGVDWPAVTEDIADNAHLALKLGATTVRVNAGCPARDGDWDTYLRDFATALQEALSRVSNIRLLVQNHPGSITAAQAGKLATLVDDPRFGVGFSPDHCVDMGGNVLETAREIAPLIGQVYIADRVRLPDGNLKACLPGEGFVPNRDLLAQLARDGFDGWVSFKWEKPTYPDLPDAEVALPHVASYLAKTSA